MRHVWFRRTIPAAVLVVSVFMAIPASATPPAKERLPLTLSGTGCSSKETELNQVLQAIPGVIGVYFNRLPNHVLVDVTPGTVKASDVVTHVNEAASSWQCKIEIIEGCISATMPTASAEPHQHE